MNSSRMFSNWDLLSVEQDLSGSISSWLYSESILVRIYKLPQLSITYFFKSSFDNFNNRFSFVIYYSDMILLGDLLT